MRCTALVTISIPASVTTIEHYLFNGCGALTSITFLGEVAPISVGEAWVSLTNVSLVGHASATSDFPATGMSFYGLVMGSTT